MKPALAFSSVCFVHPNKDEPNEYNLYAAAENSIYSFDLRKEKPTIDQFENRIQFNQDEIGEVRLFSNLFQTKPRTPDKNSNSLMFFQIRSSDHLVASCDDSGEVRIVSVTNNFGKFELVKTLRNQHTNVKLNFLIST